MQTPRLGGAGESSIGGCGGPHLSLFAPFCGRAGQQISVVGLLRFALSSALVKPRQGRQAAVGQVDS